MVGEALRQLCSVLWHLKQTEEASRIQIVQVGEAALCLEIRCPLDFMLLHCSQKVADEAVKIPLKERIAGVSNNRMTNSIPMSCIGEKFKAHPPVQEFVFVAIRVAPKPVMTNSGTEAFTRFLFNPGSGKGVRHLFREVAK